MAAVSDKINETEARRLFRRHVRRPRLTRLLDEATSQVVLITGPAGYGKTTLATEWLQGRADAVWYRATPASADLAAFSAGLSDVVQPIAPGAGERLKQRLRVAEAPEKAARPLAELLAEDLDAWPKEGLVVVDDYHLVADSGPVEEFVDWLLLLAPIRFVVTARHRPKWASARRVLYGEITEIGRDQLALTQDEAAEVLGDRSTDSVRHLVAQAEGWPALIGLAGLCASAEVPEERVSEALFRYFAEEVFRREPPEVQRFMLIASIPSTVSLDVSRAVLNADGASEIIEYLAAEGLLTPSGSSERRFHPLVRDFLRGKLEQEDAEQARALAEKAVTYARGDGKWEEAFDVACRHRMVESMPGLIEDATDDLLESGRVETLENWLVSAGSAALREPGTILARVEVLTRSGAFFEAGSIAQDLAKKMPIDDRRLSRAWYLAGQALYLGSRTRAAADCHRRARKAAQSPDDLKRALWGLLLTENELELDGTHEHINELEPLAAGDLNFELRVAAGKEVVAAQSGSYSGVWEVLLPLMPLVGLATDPMAKSNFLAQAAFLNVARSHYSLAHDLAERALKVCSDLRLAIATATSIAYRAWADIGLRRFSAARTALSDLMSIASRHDDSYIRSLCGITSLRLALGSGRLGPNLDLPPEEDVARKIRGEHLGLLAMVAASTGRSNEARQHARDARAATRSVEGRYFSTYALLLADLAGGARRGLSEEAAALLSSTAEASFLDAFVLAYRSNPELLQLVGTRPELASVVRSAMVRGRDHRLARQAGIGLGIEDHESPRALLTRREREVLSLMTQGLSNSEIAKALVISPSTAKVHVRHILRKFGVNTRLQAVVFAESLVSD